MKKSILNYQYISVRDNWTRDMIASITNGEIIPTITPDPVFAFNKNVPCEVMPSIMQLKEKLNLPQKYILMSFLDIPNTSVSQKWIENFTDIANQNGIECVSLPFAHSDSFGVFRHSIPLPLSPLEWYVLIKNAYAYIGNNMHPIIVSLHNHVPFFSFDTYGAKYLNGFVCDESSSKIKHILTEATLSDYRDGCISRGHKPIEAHKVYDLVTKFDTDKAKNFATKKLYEYDEMMNNIIDSITK